MHFMNKFRVFAVLIVIIALFIGYFIYNSEKGNGRFAFKYGLDLSGGTQLIYRADTSKINPADINKSMDVLRSTIERRVNLFGVSEPVVQIEKGGAFSSQQDQNRLIVELPGVTNVDEALKAIGKTPLLEFKLLTKDQKMLDALQKAKTEADTKFFIENADKIYIPTGITGGQLKRASLVFGQAQGVTGPTVTLEFNSEGTDLFAKVTRENVGNVLAIFLDGQIISSPVIRQEITGGTAQIDGNFTADEGKQLVNNLNFGALPLPIEILSTQTIGASLGENTLATGLKALILAMICVSIFMTLYYRLPGLIASVALSSYLVVMLALFKLIPVVLTAPGIAGFILTIGMSVDGNVLIFERMREELNAKRNLKDAIHEGFKRAWPSIRDGHISSILAAVILYWFSGTSLIKGFALVFALGVLASLLSSVVVSRTFMFAVAHEKLGKLGRFFYSKGFTNIKQ
jgi:preprotein translocase subunit SecD